MLYQPGTSYTIAYLPTKLINITGLLLQHDNIHIYKCRFFYTVCIYLRATAFGQNNDNAINFKLTTADLKKIIFTLENPEHDFPKK